MPRTDATELFDRSMTALCEQLEQGFSGGFKDWLRLMAGLHRYSLRNTLLIHAQRPDATRVAGFRQWKKLGRSVKKGERGIAICVPHVRKVEDDAGETERRITGYGSGYVFDASQTAGEPLPEPVRIHGDGASLLPQIEAGLAAAGIELEISSALRGADGASCGGKVLVRPGLDPNRRAAVLLHEWAHEVMHKSAERCELTRQQKELGAEATAYAVGFAHKLDARTASADYIRLYRGDRESLEASLGRIREATHTILQTLEEVEVRAASKAMAC